MSRKYKTTVEVDEDIAEKLKSLAAEDDRTITNYIRKILVNHVNSVYTDVEPNHSENVTLKQNTVIEQIPLPTKQVAKVEKDMNFAKELPKIKNKIF